MTVADYLSTMPFDREARFCPVCRRRRRLIALLSLPCVLGADEPLSEKAKEPARARVQGGRIRHRQEGRPNVFKMLRRALKIEGRDDFDCEGCREIADVTQRRRAARA